MASTPKLAVHGVSETGAQELGAATLGHCWRPQGLIVRTVQTRVRGGHHTPSVPLFTLPDGSAWDRKQSGRPASSQR